jgi:hypothetical protein
MSSTTIDNSISTPSATNVSSQILTIPTFNHTINNYSNNNHCSYNSNNNTTTNNNNNVPTALCLYPPSYTSNNYIHRTDSQSSLDIRIDKNDLRMLDSQSLLSIQSDPTSFIEATLIPLLHISKQMRYCPNEPSIEQYFRWTPPNGACFLNLIHQTQYRQQHAL